MFRIGDFSDFSDTFIETGACSGAGIQRALDGGFKYIRSVEVHSGLFNHTCERFESNNNVSLYYGVSYERLSEMLENLKKPLVIMLDAHPAGPGTGGHEECLNGDETVFQHSIIQKELEIILSHRTDHLVIIDDQVPGGDSEIYIETLKSANPAYKFTFYDEQLGDSEPLFKNKVFVADPR